MERGSVEPSRSQLAVWLASATAFALDHIDKIRDGFAIFDGAGPITETSADGISTYGADEGLSFDAV